MKNYQLQRTMRFGSLVESINIPVSYQEGQQLLAHYCNRDQIINDRHCMVDSRHLVVRIKADGFFSKTHLVRC